MKLYKTVNFKSIKEIDVISFDKETYTRKLSDIHQCYQKGRKWESKDVELTRKRYRDQTAHHETLEEAKNFVLSKLRTKILKKKQELIKLEGMISEFE